MLKKIISIFLVLLMLTSSTGIAMTTHYCGDYAVDMEISLGHASLNCGIEGMDGIPCPGEDGHPQIQQDNCCNNVSVTAEIDGHSLKISDSLNIDFCVVFATAYLESYSLHAEKQTPYLIYSPPLLAPDIPILHQSFLL